MKRTAALLGCCIALIATMGLVGCNKASAQAAMDHRRWLLNAYAGEYLAVGQKSVQWDGLVLAALTNRVAGRLPVLRGRPAPPDWRPGIASAIEAGCRDPLVVFLDLVAKDGLGKTATLARMELWTNTATAWSKSPYSAYHKLYVSLGAIQALRSATGKNSPQAVSLFYEEVIYNVSQLLGDPATPIEEIYRISKDVLRIMSWTNTGRTRYADLVEPYLRGSRRDSWEKHDLLGTLSMMRAWVARGGGFAKETTEEQWAGFHAHADAAEKEFVRAWKIEPHVETAIQMMEAQLNHSDSEEALELWFTRAMSLKPDSYEAARAKYHYLNPSWHGSRDLQHAFAQACVASTNWTGNVPLIMVDYHDDGAAAYRKKGQANEEYFAQASVWNDIHAAMERYFQLNPGNDGWRHNYFWYAYTARQWEIAAAQLDQLGEPINYKYFGGEEVFRAMVKTVREKTAGKKP